LAVEARDMGIEVGGGYTLIEWEEKINLIEVCWFQRVGPTLHRGKVATTMGANQHTATTNGIECFGKKGVIFGTYTLTCCAAP